MGRYDDDYQDDELDDEPEEFDDDAEDLGSPRSGANPFGSGKPRTAPPGTSGLGPRPSGLVTGGPGASGSTGGSRPNLPGSPPSTYGSSRPNLPGSPPSTLGGNRPNLPGSPSSSSTYGSSSSRPNLPGSPPSTIGSRPPSQPPKNEPRSGGLLGGLGGNKNDAAKPGSGANKGLSGLGSRLPFGGGNKSDKPAAPKANKGERGNPLGGFASKLPFGGNKPAEPKRDSKPGGLGARMPFGGGRNDAPKSDARPASTFGGGSPSSTSSPLGGSRSTFGGSSDAFGGSAAKSTSARSATTGQRRFEAPFGLGKLFGGKKEPKAAKQRASRAPKVDQGGLSLDTKLDILGVALVVVSLALLLASLSPNQGAITGQVNDLLSYTFGWGAVAVPIIMLAAGIWLLIRHFGDDAPTLQLQRIIGLAVLFMSILTLMQFFESWSYNIQDPNYLTALREVYLPWTYEQGRGGGLVGGEIYYFLLSNFTEWGGFALLFIPLIVGIMLSLSISAAELAMIVVSNVRNMRDRAQQRSIRVSAERAQREEQQRALTAQSQIGVAKPETQALPGRTPAALPSPAESPVPMPLPLGEQRSISITQGGRTINTSFNPDDLDEDEPLVPAARQGQTTTTQPAASAAQTAEKSSGRSGLGLGRLVPGGLAIGAAAAVRALTPTEESAASAAKEQDKPENTKRGLGSLLPFGGRKNGSDNGDAPEKPAVKTDKPADAAAPARPAATSPVAAANVKPPVQQPAASLGAPTSASTAPASPESGERPPRFGDVIRQQGAGTRPASDSARPARPESAATSAPASPLRPQSVTPTTPTTTPPTTPLPRPITPAAQETKPASEEDEWSKLPPAQPKGVTNTPANTPESPFAPRVMQPRPEGTAASAKP
ncbi:MAG: hypothetical protein IT320_02030, partial [Anaerolineae bacterium]|nr:hypothetical protein [Anaerolineae bacterium]